MPRDLPAGHGALFFIHYLLHHSYLLQESVVWSMAPQLYQNSSHTFGFNNFNTILRKNATSRR